MVRGSWGNGIREGVESPGSRSLRGLNSVDCCLGESDRFEVGFDFEVGVEAAIRAGCSPEAAWGFDARTRDIVGADALENSPGLVEFLWRRQRLVRSGSGGRRVRPSRKTMRRVFPESHAAAFEHDLQDEVVLRGGVFDVRGWGEERLTDFVLLRIAASRCAASSRLAWICRCRAIRPGGRS